MAKQRNIDVSIKGALPMNGYKAALHRIADYETRLADGEDIKAINSEKGDKPLKHVCTSLSAYEVYVFDLVNFDPAAGDYEWSWLK
jgi:hypothetical protein